MTYQPSKEILDKYADVIVNFALGGGKGVREGEVVFLAVPECAKPLLLSLRRAVLKAGGHAIMNYIPDEVSKEFFEIASDDQISYFPEKFLRGRVEQMDHLVGIEADANPHELEGIDSKKIMMGQKAMKPYRDWRDEKENEGRFTWVLCLYGTSAMAKEAGLSEEEYWNEIIKACYLDFENPKEKWKEIQKEIFRVRDKLNSMKIEKLHIKSEGTDLFVKLGENRNWKGCDGRNVPSFEVFISPDWRGTEGHVTFTEPLYRYGNLIEGVYLEFKDGCVTKASATKGENVLKEMIAVENADKIGEFSLTDSRLSRISKYMATTLFDENTCGKSGKGNFHLALGNAYKDCFSGNPAKVKKEEWAEMGYNESAVHTDIVSTSDRVVTAVLSSGEKKVIYENGRFVI
jgi:aminopeptidase